MVSGSNDNSLRVWDVSTAQCLQTLNGHTDYVSHLGVLPNSQVVRGYRDSIISKSMTIDSDYSYQMIRPVLKAIIRWCGLQKLSLGKVYIGQKNYEHLRQLVQNVPSLTTLDLSF